MRSLKKDQLTFFSIVCIIHEGAQALKLNKLKLNSTLLVYIVVIYLLYCHKTKVTILKLKVL